jgi:hypothetical protein
VVLGVDRAVSDACVEKASNNDKKSLANISEVLYTMFNNEP